MGYNLLISSYHSESMNVCVLDAAVADPFSITPQYTVAGFFYPEIPKAIFAVGGAKILEFPGWKLIALPTVIRHIHIHT